MIKCAILSTGDALATPCVPDLAPVAELDHEVLRRGSWVGWRADGHGEWSIAAIGEKQRAVSPVEAIRRVSTMINCGGVVGPYRDDSGPPWWINDPDVHRSGSRPPSALPWVPEVTSMTGRPVKIATSADLRQCDRDVRGAMAVDRLAR